MSRTRRPTLAEVAARAGVAVSTASLAFSDSPRVAAATRDRVMAAAAELGYLGPDPAARSLRSRRSGIVGAILCDRLLHAFRDPFAVQLHDAMAEVLGPLGVGLLLVPGDDRSPGAVVGRLSRVPLDAAAFTAGVEDDDPALEHLRRRGVPVAAVDGPPADDLALVRVTDRAASRELARHLRDLGHRRVAVVTLQVHLDGRRGPIPAQRWTGPHFREPQDRLRGVEDVLGPLPAWETATNSVEEGEAAALQLLDAPAAERPTAVVAQSDVLAVGVLRAAVALGLRVPDDVSVAGFDGVSLPGVAPVRLTTVVQPVGERGRSLGLLVAALVAGERPRDVLLDASLRVGGTTGPAPQ